MIYRIGMKKGHHSLTFFKFFFHLQNIILISLYSNEALLEFYFSARQNVRVLNFGVIRVLGGEGYIFVYKYVSDVCICNISYDVFVYDVYIM